LAKSSTPKVTKLTRCSTRPSYVRLFQMLVVGGCPSPASGAAGGPLVAATAGAQPQRSEDDIVHPLLILGHAGSVGGFADFAGCRFQLIPDITAPLDKQRISRVDHDGAYSIFQHGHAAHPGGQGPYGDDPEASFSCLEWRVKWRGRWCARFLVGRAALLWVER